MVVLTSMNSLYPTVTDPFAAPLFCVSTKVSLPPYMYSVLSLIVAAVNKFFYAAAP